MFSVLLHKRLQFLINAALYRLWIRADPPVSGLVLRLTQTRVSEVSPRSAGWRSADPSAATALILQRCCFQMESVSFLLPVIKFLILNSNTEASRSETRFDFYTWMMLGCKPDRQMQGSNSGLEATQRFNINVEFNLIYFICLSMRIRRL